MIAVPGDVVFIAKVVGGKNSPIVVVIPTRFHPPSRLMPSSRSSQSATS